MFKRKGSYNVVPTENMRGGDGVVLVEHLLTPEELYDNGRLYARLVIEPGCSIGPHVHDGEMESFYIVSGEAEISDCGKVILASAGDCSLTRSGEEHSVRNVGSVTLEIIALILFSR